jgi:hypothetical protein
MESMLVESWVQKMAFDLVDKKGNCLVGNKVEKTGMLKVALLVEPWVEKMVELMVFVTVASKEKYSVDEMES